MGVEAGQFAVGGSRTHFLDFKATVYFYFDCFVLRHIVQV